MGVLLYRVIHKSLRDFRPLRYSSRDGHAEGEHVNRGRETLNFCPTLQVLDVSILGDAADVNPVIKLECLSLCWHAPLRRDRPGYCTAEAGNPGGTYELPCIISFKISHCKRGEQHTKHLFGELSDNRSNAACRRGRRSCSDIFREAQLVLVAKY